MLAGGLQKYIFQGPYLFLYFPSQSQIKLHKLQYTQLGSKKKKKNEINYGYPTLKISVHKSYKYL